MKKFFIVPVFCFLMNFCIAQTQASLSQDAAGSFKTSDKTLNTVYQKILKEYGSDKVFIKNLVTAQKAWIVFRDAQVKARYPDRPAGYYGSAQPSCIYNYKTALTQQRITALNEWADGVEEGDVCAGSVKTKK